MKEKIYPVALVLNVKNQDDNHATFLDIEVIVKEINSRLEHKIKEKITSLRLSTIQIYLEIFLVEQDTVLIHHK